MQCKQQQEVVCRREPGISTWLLPLGAELKMNLAYVAVKGRNIQRPFQFLLVSLCMIPIDLRGNVLLPSIAMALSP